MVVVGASISSHGGISSRSLAAALDGAARLAEMEAGVATLDLLIDLGDHYDRKGGTTPDSGGLGTGYPLISALCTWCWWCPSISNLLLRACRQRVGACRFS
jgi:hypothetical protein